MCERYRWGAIHRGWGLVHRHCNSRGYYLFLQIFLQEIFEKLQNIFVVYEYTNFRYFFGNVDKLVGGWGRWGAGKFEKYVVF